MATQFVVILYTDSGPTKNSGYVNDQKKQKKTLVNIMNNISLLYFFYIIATLKSTAHRQRAGQLQTKVQRNNYIAIKKCMIVATR